MFSLFHSLNVRRCGPSRYQCACAPSYEEYVIAFEVGEEYSEICRRDVGERENGSGAQAVSATIILRGCRLLILLEDIRNPATESQRLRKAV